MNNENRKSKNISYTILITFIFIAIVVVVNIFARSLDSKYKRIDVSSMDVYSLTDTTHDFLKNLNKDVTIYTIAETGGEDEVIETIVGRYLSESNRLKHEIVNPVENPQFISNYGINLSQGSLLVVCGDKHVSIDKSDMMYSVETSAGTNRVMIDIEGLITAAISKVTSDKTPKAYVMMGTDKIGLDSGIIKAIEKQNIDIETLRYSETKKIPEDADVIVLFSPTADITDDEYTALDEFMNNGGKLMYMQYFSTSDEIKYNNISALFAKYNVSFPVGNVIEGDADYYAESDSPFRIYPILQKHEITQSLIDNNQKVMYMISSRLQIDEAPENVKVDVLLKTSHSAYLKNPGDSTMIKLATDVGGVFDLAAAITDNNTNAKAVVFSSYAIAYDEIDKAVNGNNSDLLINAFCWLTDQTQVVSINPKRYGLANLLLSAKFKNKFLIMFVIIVPVAIIAVGLAKWIRRRTR